MRRIGFTGAEGHIGYRELDDRSGSSRLKCPQNSVRQQPVFSAIGVFGGCSDSRPTGGETQLPVILPWSSAAARKDSLRMRPVWRYRPRSLNPGWSSGRLPRGQ